MVYQEVKFNQLVCEQKKPLMWRNIGIDFDDDEIEEYEIEKEEWEKEKLSSSIDSTRERS